MPARQTIKEHLIAEGLYGGDCAACKHPIVKGRTLCLHCERLAVLGEEVGA